MAGLDGCGKLDISEMSYDNIVVIGDKVWVRAEVEEKIWYYNNVPCTVVKLGEACYARICNDLDPIPKGLLAGANFLNLFMDCAGNAAGGDQGGDPPPCEGCSEDPASDCYTPGGCPEETLPPEEEQEPTPGSSLGNGNERKARSVDSSLDKPKIEPAKNNIDIRALNALGWKGMAVIPSAAIIPMKSNTTTYGPYASSNFGTSCGGTQVEVNTDLAPWVFGSSGAMNAAGQTLVESSAIGLNKAESGAITIPGMPISQFTNLGAVLGSGGATLSSMNFSYGSNGITTSYEFRTYTPKFGGLNRHLIDRIKDIARNRTEALRFFRNQEIMINKAGRQRAIFNQKLANRDALLNRAPNDRNSLQRLFIGAIYDWQGDGQRTVLGTDKLLDSVAEMVHGFNTKAYGSWDLFFGPISKYGDGGLPRFAEYDKGCHLASPDLPQPPYAKDEYPSDPNNNPFTNGLDQNNIDINRDYLDPLTNNFEANQHHHNGKGRGHVVDIVGGGDSVPNDGMITNFYRLDDPDRYDDDYRFFGMRGPIVLHSWGYDTQGKPIPNEADIDADTKEGRFKDTYLKDSFLKDWLAKPATWPVAPIDFRFDRKRGVWVSPPGYKVVVAILEERLDEYGVAEASLINFGSTLYDKNGEPVKATEEEDTEAKIKVVDRIGKSYSSGTKIYAYYDTSLCEYIVLEGIETKSIRFRIIDMCDGTPVEPDYGDDWTKYAGFGDKFPNNHILGIRINCEGDPIDNKGNFVTHDDILDEEKRKNILINLFDTCGKFGSAYAHYNVNGGQAAFNEWKDKAATGFGLLCDPTPDGTCILGENETQCSTVNIDYDSYDIVFLDNYARFIECKLTQKLYMTAEEASKKCPEDEYKIQHLEGNAAATILHFYGDPGNGIEPKFYKNNAGGLAEIEFRVFDPFLSAPKLKNQFLKLDVGDIVLAVFDEDRKKYVIYNALKADDKVVKFAVAQAKKRTQDTSFEAVLLNYDNLPVDTSGNLLDATTFNQNFITIRDPYAFGIGKTPGSLSTILSGPAIGSNIFDEHINGIAGITDNYDQYGPFMGFALQEITFDATTGESNVEYTLMFLETFADTISGKVATRQEQEGGGIFYGVLGGFTNGRAPFTRSTNAIPNNLNVKVQAVIGGVEGTAWVMGDFYDGAAIGPGDTIQTKYNAVDGCKFLAILDRQKSFQNNEDLIYLITESETVADRGWAFIKTQEAADELNGEPFGFHFINDTCNNTRIETKYYNGWYWDKNKSKINYNLTKIYNKAWWIEKPLLLQNAPLNLELNNAPNNDPNIAENWNGDIWFKISDAYTIAQVVEKKSGGGKDLSLEATNESKTLKSTDKAYHGYDEVLRLQKPPKIIINNPFMSYEDGFILTLLDEYADKTVEEKELYRVVYAREAPVIITGIAYEEFEPFKETDIGIDLTNTLYPSCPGYDKKPVIDLVVKAKNPMGFGALPGDLVTLQRVYTTTVQDDANYYYIIIGTGKLVGAN